MRAFECKMCGTCCFGEGGIRLEKVDVMRIARFLKISSEAFVAEYCETRNRRLYIRTAPDGYCIFHHWKDQCLIHPVVPSACSLWPYYTAILKDRDAWEEAMQACPGINPDCSFEEFVRQAKAESD